MYCVYLTVYKGNLLPPFYIGSTSIDKIENGYRGSVGSKQYKEIWKSEIKYNSQLFKTHIIKIFNDRKAAADYEGYIQRLLHVQYNPLYINMAQWHNGHLNYIHSEESKRKISLKAKNQIGPMLGKKHTEQTKLKMKAKASKYWKGRKRSKESITQAVETRKRNNSYGTFLGKKHTDATKAKIKSKKQGSKHSEESKQKMSDSHKGIFHSEESKQKISISKMKTWIVQTPDLIIVKTNNLYQWCVDQGFDNPKSAASTLRSYGKYKGYIIQPMKQSVNDGMNASCYPFQKPHKGDLHLAAF